MTFDFDGAMERAQEDMESRLLEAMLLAPSGGGKSARGGTFGVKTMYLYAGGEAHGVRAAKMLGGKNVVAVRYDHNAKTPDEAVQNLTNILKDASRMTKLGIEAVYVDGASELEILIRASQAWKNGCLTAKGDHNTYEETKQTLNGFRPIIVAMKDLAHNNQVHIAMSLIVDVKEYGDCGEIIECQPRILGYGVAEGLIQQFGDTLVVSRLHDKDTQKTEYRFQFMSDVVKASKDKHGVVKKSINFSPRISGVKKVPPYMPANFSDVVTLKQKEKE